MPFEEAQQQIEEVKRSYYNAELHRNQLYTQYVQCRNEEERNQIGVRMRMFEADMLRYHNHWLALEEPYITEFTTLFNQEFGEIQTELDVIQRQYNQINYPVGSPQYIATESTLRSRMGKLQLRMERLRSEQNEFLQRHPG